MTQNISLFFGPLIGGLIIVPLGVGGLMLANASARCAVVILLFFLRPVPVEALASSRPRLLHAIVEGLAYAWRTPVLRWALILFGGTSIFTRPFLQLMPAIDHDALRVGATRLSWLVGAEGMGASIGSFLSASLGCEGRRGLLGSIFTLMAGVLVIALSLQRDILPAVIVSGAVGFAHSIQTNLCNVIPQAESPDAVRGRVMSFQTMSQQTLSPLSAAALGFLGSFVGINYSLLIGRTCVAFLGVFVLSAVPVIRDLRFRPIVAGTSG